MTLQTKIKKSWKKAINDYGITKLSKEAKVDVRTIKRAVEGNKFREVSYTNVNAAILRLKNISENDFVVKQILADDSN